MQVDKARDKRAKGSIVRVIASFVLLPFFFFTTRKEFVPMEDHELAAKRLNHLLQARKATINAPVTLVVSNGQVGFMLEKQACLLPIDASEESATDGGAYEADMSKFDEWCNKFT